MKPIHACAALSRVPFQASALPAGLAASPPSWAQRGQVFGDKPTEKPSGELGAEQASRNEAQGAREEAYHKPLCSPLPRALVVGQPQATHPSLAP